MTMDKINILFIPYTLFLLLDTRKSARLSVNNKKLPLLIENINHLSKQEVKKRNNQQAILIIIFAFL